MSIGELEEAIRHHNYLYFVKAKPEISDEEFDRLVQKLRKCKPDSSVLTQVGSDVLPTATAVRHQVPMLSLDKCYSEKEIQHWAEKFSGDVVASPKIDGCAVSLKYNSKGALTLAATRGNGIEGEVITPNAKFVRAIPKETSLKNVEVRGEIHMPLSVFKRFKGEFANPRNLAAGAIKQKDPKKTAEYQLSFLAYDILNADAETEVQKQRLLEEGRFPVVEWRVVAKEEMQKVFEGFLTKGTRFDFETDGVVFKANEVAEQNRLGATAHHPRYAIAYKFQGETGETVIRDIIWSVSRTGTITPVGIVDPVGLSGARVTRVTLHNYGLAKKMGVTLGAKVRMMRRGGVIPNVEKVIQSKGGALRPPSQCPSCGSAVELVGDFLYCTNPKRCAVTKIAELDHFVKTVDIEGFGRKHLQQLYEMGLVKDAADFYTLKTHNLLPLERMGKTLATKLVTNIEMRRKLPLEVFLRALGIDELGKHTSKILADFGSLKKVLVISAKELDSVHTVGEKIARAVVQGLKEKRPLIDRLLKFVTIEEGEPRKRGGLLSGKSFLFTGALLDMEREKAQALVEANGGVAATGISLKLDYLVVGDGGKAGTKLDKAKKLIAQGVKIQILSEKEFLKMIG